MPTHASVSNRSSPSKRTEFGRAASHLRNSLRFTDVSIHRPQLSLLSDPVSAHTPAPVGFDSPGLTVP